MCISGAGESDSEELEESKLANHYPLEMVVEEDSALLGKDLMGAGMLTMDGLTVVSISTKVGEIVPYFVSCVIDYI